MTGNPVLLIAKNEFMMLITHPMVIILTIVMVAYAIINACGSSVLLPDLASANFKDPLISVGLGNIFYCTSLFTSLFALSVGLMSMSGERSSKTLNVLITKPLYRRDILLGKYIGINLFLIIFIFITISFFISLMMVAYNAPFSIDSFLLRYGSFLFILTINCMLTVGISMLIAIIVKDLLFSIVLSSSYLFLGWFSDIPLNIGIYRIINPVNLYLTLFIPGRVRLSETSIQYATWLNDAYPYIILILIEIASVFLISIYLFDHDDI